MLHVYVCVCVCVCGAREVCPRLSCRDTLKITVLPTLKFVDSFSAFIFLSFFLIFVLSFSNQIRRIKEKEEDKEEEEEYIAKEKPRRTFSCDKDDGGVSVSMRGHICSEGVFI